MTPTDPLDTILDMPDSEGASDRDGYLSWQGEWHAAAWGFVCGFLAGLTGFLPVLVGGVGWIFTAGKDAPNWLPYPRQFAKESLYLLAHSLPGLALGIGVRLFVVAPLLPF